MLKGFEKKYLRGLAHGLEPLIIVGQKGLTDGLIRSVNEALDIHELIKIRFNDFKEKDQKNEIMSKISSGTGAEMAGMIGHTAVLYRQHHDPEKRKIMLPKK